MDALHWSDVVVTRHRSRFELEKKKNEKNSLQSKRLQALAGSPVYTRKASHSFHYTTKYIIIEIGSNQVWVFRTFPH